MSIPTFEHYDAKVARIMVVDDERANLKLLSLMLRTEGYAQVELVQDPREVLASYKAARPDLILLDINMPHLDGYAVMEQLCALSDPLAPPIVVLTAQSGEEFLLRALKGGASDFLSKPFNRRELLARVNNTLMAHLAHRLIHDRTMCSNRWCGSVPRSCASRVWTSCAAWAAPRSSATTRPASTSCV